MEKLFTTLGMALADIIYQCERRKNSNLDINLKNIVYALDDIAQILKDNYITRIYFTSRFVETKFRSNFKEILKQYSSIELITLPSPSPRYAQMTKNQKLEKYKELLPVI
jgi:G:T/U-mismatch repair DNA glycosylase